MKHTFQVKGRTISCNVPDNPADYIKSAMWEKNDKEIKKAFIQIFLEKELITEEQLQDIDRG